MILNTLRLHNYKQYGHLELEFREGLVGIIGKNGAGKSTIFEAILYCLFGRDEANKSLVRSAFADNKANVELELVFSLGETVYRVRREFRGKALAVGAEFFKNDTLVAKGVSPVNDALVRVLNIERDAFKRSVFSGQKELSELSDTSGEARKRMVRRMLGFDTLDEAQTRINAELRDLNSQAAGQRQNLLSDEVLQTLHDEMTARETTLAASKAETATEAQVLRDLQEKYRLQQEKFDREEAKFKQHSALRNELTQTEERLAGLQRERENLAKKQTELLAQKTMLDTERREWAGFEADKKALEIMEAEHSRHINQQARLAKINETREQLETNAARLKTLAQELVAQDSVERALAEQQKNLVALDAQIKARLEEHRALEKQIGGIQANIQERREKLENLRQLGREGHCPTCLQPLLEGYERVTAALENEMTALQNTQLQDLESQKHHIVEAGKWLREEQESARIEADRLLKAQTRLLELSRQKNAESAQQNQLQARLAADELILREIGEVNFDATAHQALKSKIAAQEPRYRTFLTQENYIARELPATLEALLATETATAETEARIVAGRAALEGVGYDEQAYTLAKQAVSAFGEAFQMQNERLRMMEKTSLELEAEQSKSAERIRANERIAAQISDKLEELELLRKLAEMLALFKTEILEKVSPGISREASELFTRITKGKYEGIRVDENFDFAIADGGLFYPIERFSGGEVDLANFCLRIAITKAIMDLSGSGQRLEFLAFDEIFGSQDEDRRMEMMLALNYLQEQFRQIYIVSHIDSLKDYFPHLLEVQHAAEGSVATWR